MTPRDASGAHSQTARPTRTPLFPPSSAHTNGAGLALELPDALIDALAERVADLLADREPGGPEPWIGVEDAAEHLACGKSRLYALVSARRIPHEKDGSRLLFRRSELDRWLEQGGARRP
jgi:excisionase family DNA binding protein